MVKAIRKIIDIGDPMVRQAHRGALMFQVQREIFCPKCGSVMDVRRAVQITISSDGRIQLCKTYCTRCTVEHMHAEDLGWSLLDKLPDVTEIEIEILDGRTLFGRSKKRNPSYTLTFSAAIAAAQADGALPGQLPLFGGAK